ncbi:DUF58 domain-containing protein [Segnochrobactrum spirostomi]|uniref:DUF58 domain-containing protein n=1 Tax=Segnochrobactrum spirostomi TaxID=2608987 RepID=A0A6A7Y8B6_9HYPH|nr:DUF58 domain-containing protein [Segnochrobactrum spirostomi]MQT14945.1 DUF58 domain-containing protein [Segnochrobactrum spirostomi]
MVSAALQGQGIRLRAADLLALREGVPRDARHRPATRRPGALPAKPAGAGMDLREIRAFAEGDDARRIDPAATARTGSPHVRTFHEDRDDTVLLVADFRGPMLWGTGSRLRSVAAAHVLARRGWQAVARGATVGALAVGARGITALPGAAGAPHMSRLCHLLALWHDEALEAASEARAAEGPGGDGGLTEALVRAARLAPSGGEVMIATGPDGVAPVDEPALARLARRRRVRLVLPLDPIETAPPPAPLPVRAGALARLARLCPLETAPLAARLRALNVTLEVLSDDSV